MPALIDASSTHLLVDLYTAVEREASMRTYAAHAGKSVTMISPRFWTSPIAPFSREIKEGFVLKQRADAQEVRRHRLHLWVEVLKGTSSALRHNASLGAVERELNLHAQSDRAYQALLLSHEMAIKEPQELRKLPLGSIWRLLDHTLHPRQAPHPVFPSGDLRKVLLSREGYLIDFAKYVPGPEGRALIKNGASADREAFAYVDAEMCVAVRKLREEAAVFTQALDHGVRDPLAPLTASRAGAEFAASL